MTRTRNNELTAQIVQKASVGETKKKIAEDLGVSPTTIQNHLKPLKGELNERINNGEDPLEAWGAVLAGILIGAGTAGAILVCIKFYEEIRKQAEEREK